VLTKVANGKRKYPDILMNGKNELSVAADYHLEDDRFKNRFPILSEDIVHQSALSTLISSSTYCWLSTSIKHPADHSILSPVTQLTSYHFC